MEEKKDFIQIELDHQEVSSLLESLRYRQKCLRIYHANAIDDGFYALSNVVDGELKLVDELIDKLDAYYLPF